LRELGAVPISLDNKNQEDTVDENFELTKSYMGVPMIIGNQVLGVISVQSSVYEEHFSESDLRLLTTIAANTAIAIQNARSFEEAQLRAQREHALSKITAAVRASTDPAVIMRTAVREIGATLGRKAEIRVLSEQTGEK
jgi:GAF domain-containing protein